MSTKTGINFNIDDINNINEKTETQNTNSGGLIIQSLNDKHNYILVVPVYDNAADLDTPSEYTINTRWYTNNSDLNMELSEIKTWNAVDTINLIISMINLK